MADECVGFFKAVSDDHRVKIMELLRKRDMCVSELCEHFDMKQPSVSHHLNILKAAGVIHSKKCGKEMIYSLDDKYVCSCCNKFSDKFSEEETTER